MVSDTTQDEGRVDAEASSGSDESRRAATSTSKWPVVLIVVATAIAVLSAATTWVRTTALDTDQWVSTSDRLLDDEEITSALAAYLVNQLYTQVDVAGGLESLLPADLSGLAGPLAGVLRDPATSGVERALSSDRFATLWTVANRQAHQRLVAVLRDETRPGVSTANGVVTLELGPVVRQVGEDLGIPTSALDRLPADAGNIVVFQSNELANAQAVIKVLDVLSWFLFLVTAALYALAVYLAHGRRRHTLALVGAALVVGGGTVLAMTALGIRTGVEFFVQDPSNATVARAVAFIQTDLLRQIAWAGIVYGVLIAGFAMLRGEHRWAVAVRNRLSVTTPARAVGATIALTLAALLWSPGRAFDRWVTALVAVALIAGAMASLVVQARRSEVSPSDAELGLDAS